MSIIKPNAPKRTDVYRRASFPRPKAERGLGEAERELTGRKGTGVRQIETRPSRLWRMPPAELNENRKLNKLFGG